MSSSICMVPIPIPIPGILYVNIPGIGICIIPIPVSVSVSVRYGCLSSIRICMNHQPGIGIGMNVQSCIGIVVVVSVEHYFKHT